MRTSRHHLLSALLATFVVLAGCKDETAVKNNPDFVPQPTSLQFAACPSVDSETGEPIPDIFPDRQKFTLENLGKVGGPVALKITGEGADQFKIVQEGLLETLGAGASGEIFIEFTPTSSGEVNATLEIDDGTEDTELVKVSLFGTGSTMPAQPKIKISYENWETGEWVDCLEYIDGSINNCGPMVWPDTYNDQEKTLKVKLQNLGCPTLKVTGIDLEPFVTGSSVQFHLDKPVVTPSTASPIELFQSADKSNETELEIRFAPQKDNSGDDTKWAILKVQSNAKASPESLVSLRGVAAEPSLYTTPTYCNFSDPGDLCGGFKVPTSGNDAKMVFQVTNGGNSALTVKTVKSQGNSSRFSISAEGNPVGKTILPGDSEPLEILYSDAPLFVQELFDITAESNGQPTNTATVRVTGGVLPCLYTNPETELLFSDVVTSGKKILEVCNRDISTKGTACGDLTINGTRIVQSGSYFKITQAPSSGATVAPGQCTNVEIEFTKPVNGGQQIGTIEIQTNDPEYSKESPKKVTLYSEQPLDQIPVAVLEGPNKETNTMSIGWSALNPKRITLHGEFSYDPPSNGPVAEYRFNVQKPKGSTAVYGTDYSISFPGTGDDAQNVRSTSPQIDLNLPVLKEGEYVIYLEVWDNVGQKSTADALRILVKSQLDP